MRINLFSLIERHFALVIRSLERRLPFRRIIHGVGDWNFLLCYRRSLSAERRSLLDLAVQVDKNHLIGVTHIVHVDLLLAHVKFARALHQVGLLRGRDASANCVALDVEVWALHINMTGVLASILIWYVCLDGHDFVFHVRARRF